MVVSVQGGLALVLLLLVFCRRLRAGQLRVNEFDAGRKLLLVHAWQPRHPPVYETEPHMSGRVHAHSCLAAVADAQRRSQEDELILPSRHQNNTPTNRRQEEREEKNQMFEHSTHHADCPFLRVTRTTDSPPCALSRPSMVEGMASRVEQRR